MRRIFGAQKKKEPAPTLEQAGDRLTSRGDRIDEQINKLDQQLMKFREQIKKTRPGPAQEALKKRALTVGISVMCYISVHACMSWGELLLS
jgi:charged multivesicular body protein 5